MQAKLSPELREALREVERINADMQQVFATIAALEAKADETSANMYRAAGGILKVAGQSQGSQMGVVLGEAAGVVALAGLAYQGGAWLWGKIKRSWALMKILPEKQALAEEKRPILLEILPRLESHSQRLQLCLDQFSSEPIDGSMLDKFDPLWSEICDVVSGYFRSCFMIAYTRWLLLQFDAWEEGEHDSGEIPPAEGAWSDMVYLYLLNSIESHVDQAKAASLPLGAIYVAHLDVPSETIRANAIYSKIISLISSRRIRSLLLPFSSQSRDERALYSRCLAGATAVGSRVRNTFLAWIGVFATISGSYFVVGNLNAGATPPPSGPPGSQAIALPTVSLPQICAGLTVEACFQLAQERERSASIDGLTEARRIYEAMCGAQHGPSCLSLALMRCDGRASAEGGSMPGNDLFTRACSLGENRACGLRCGN